MKKLLFFFTLFFSLTAVAHADWAITATVVPNIHTAQITGTLTKPDGSHAPANMTVYTRHVVKTNPDTTLVGAPQDPNTYTDSSGNFSVTLGTSEPLTADTNYLVDITAIVPTQTASVRTTLPAFHTNPSPGGNASEGIAFDDPPFIPSQTGIIVKLKATGLAQTTTSMTVELRKDGYTLAEKNVTGIKADVSGNATFEAPFNGLAKKTEYDVQVTSPSGHIFGLGRTVSTAGGPQDGTKIAYIVMNNTGNSITSTSATFSARIIAVSSYSTSTVFFQPQAGTDGDLFPVVSDTNYHQVPTQGTTGDTFTFSFKNLSPSTTYYFKIFDEDTKNDATDIMSFTTASSTGAGEYTVTIGGGNIMLSTQFQSATSQTNDCIEDPKKGEYCLLAPIPFPGIVNGKLSLFTNDKGEGPVPTFINSIITFAIALAALLSALMIMWGGIQYMTAEAFGKKTKAKKEIQNAILGLLLALGSFLILKTINPDLVNINLQVDKHEVKISPDDTSTGSSTSLCLSSNAPNPDSATGSILTLNSTITSNYVPELNKITTLSTGTKLLITAQTAFEGFSSTPTPGTKSYRTNNPGNIKNTDNAPNSWTCSSPGIYCFSSLLEGIKEQGTMIARVANGQSKNPAYAIGSKPVCALGSEAYDGSLYQYLRIYATGARQNNNYLNAVIGHFKANGKTITARTKMSEIYNIK